MGVQPEPLGEVVAPRVDGRRARTRSALIASAQDLLSHGRTNVSIQEITDKAGVGFGSFYNHFTTKESLFDAAVEATVEDYSVVLDTLVAGIEDPAEVFAASFRLTGRLQRILPEQVRILLHTGTSILTRDGGLASRARRDLAVATEAGRFDLEDIELALMAAGGALLGLLQMLDANPDLDDAVVSDEFTARVLRALGVDAGEAAELCARALPALPDSL